MIDYLLMFATAAAAQADSIVGAYGSTDPDTGNWFWSGDCVIPNVQVWDSRQDVTTQSTDQNGNPISIVMHTYEPGFWMIIAATADVPALDSHPATQLAADSNLWAAGNPNFVLQSLQPSADLQYFMLSPTFAGRNYPFGNP